MGSDADCRYGYRSGSICLVFGYSELRSCPCYLISLLVSCFFTTMFLYIILLCHLLSAGKFSLEGKVEHKFDMEPHSENFGEYGKLCRERTNKAMIKTRQVLV